MSEKDINQLFQERFEGFEAEVDPNLWTAIEGQLPTGSAAPGDGGVSASGGSAVTGGISTTKIVSIGTVAATLLVAWGIYEYGGSKEDDAEVETVQQDLPQEAQQIEEPALVEVLEEPVEIEDVESVAESDLQISTEESSTEPSPANIDQAISDEKTQDKVVQVLEPQVEQSAENTVEVDTDPVDLEPIQQDRQESEPIAEESKDDVPKPEILEPLEAKISYEKVDGANYTYRLKNDGEARYHDWDIDGHQRIDEGPEFSFDGPGEYKVQLTVRANDGRELRDEVTITVFEEAKIFFPNVFSPNGDQSNDVYDISGTGVKSVSIRVFEYGGGKQVFSSNSFENDWAGNDNNGRPLPNGQYAVAVTYIDYSGQSHTEKRTVSLLR